MELEPIAWLFQHDETGRTMCVDAQQVEWGFEESNPRLQKISPLYSAATVEQLVREIEELKDHFSDAKELIQRIMKERDEAMDKWQAAIVDRIRLIEDRDIWRQKAIEAFEEFNK